MSEPLYNRDILRLATETPHNGRLTNPQATIEKRSPICGSRVTVDVDLGSDGRVVAVGMLVRACALGQASATLLGQHVLGRNAGELAGTRDALAAWLAGQGEAPDWPGLAVLAPVLAYPARHPSIRLAFEAAADAALAAGTARADAA